MLYTVDAMVLPVANCSKLFPVPEVRTCVIDTINLYRGSGTDSKAQEW